ncbi:efflux transporter outer membrane subunit [Cerasicoccus arenae]|nr:efflux transporter outer membrane subunit [Cerasicoccus arenae]MBK1858790.1 efflux transporter outer membrane subunit [Cerasicoccus arenae]
MSFRVQAIRRLPAATTLLVLALLVGCTVGPDYEKPSISTPDAWHSVIANEVEGEAPAPLQTWWTIFNDPVLNELIEEARESNLNLEMALVNVREARAKLAMKGGAELPEVGLSANVSRTKVSDNGILSQVAPAGGFSSQGLFVFGLDAAWEIDVFGRITREVEAEGARYEASIEDYRDVLVTLYAEVALTYIEIRSYQEHIANAQANIKVQMDSLDLTEERFNDGLTSELDIVQAKSNLYTTEAAIPQFRIRLNAAYNRLAVLCGQDASTLRSRINASSTLPLPDMEIEAGLPADLLRQRPDIRRAEREIAAATAMIGAATAELYPRFAIQGSIGLDSRSIGTQFDATSLAWTLAAPMHWNVFTAGRVQDNIDIKSEQQQKAMLEYRLSVLQAIEEVENALVSYNESRIRLGHLKQAVKATETAVELVTVQYDSGLTDFNNVLDMQRALYEQQNKMVSSSTEATRSIIALYKALGGGWMTLDGKVIASANPVVSSPQ